MLLKQLADSYYRNSRKVPATYRAPAARKRAASSPSSAASSSTSPAPSSTSPAPSSNREDEARDQFLKTMTNIVEAKDLATQKLETSGGDLGMMEVEGKKLEAAVKAGKDIRDNMVDGMYDMTLDGTTVKVNVAEETGNTISTIRNCVTFLEEFEKLKDLQIQIENTSDDKKKNLLENFDSKRNYVMRLKKRCEGQQDGMLLQKPKIPNTEDIQLVLEAINKLAGKLKSSPAQVSGAIHEVQKEAEMTGQSSTDKVKECKERLMKKNKRELQKQCMSTPDRKISEMPCRTKEVMARNMCTKDSDTDF